MTPKEQQQLYEHIAAKDTIELTFKNGTVGMVDLIGYGEEHFYFTIYKDLEKYYDLEQGDEAAAAYDDIQTYEAM